MTAILVLAATTAAADPPSIPATERQALVRFFEGTNGTSWEHKQGWLTSEDPCTWFGVVCDASPSEPSTMTIVGLLLPVNNLKGVLPAGLENLPNLRTLHLAGNHLSGEVPERWLDLWDSNKFELNLDGNRVSNFVRRVRITVSSSGVLCSFDEDVRYSIELNDNGVARFESTRCASRKQSSRKTYCLVKEGEGPSLQRFSRALKRLGFDNLAASYTFPFTFATHQTYTTTTVWWGDGRSHQVETYGGQCPIEADIAEQLVLGLAQLVTWKQQSREAECSSSP